MDPCSRSIAVLLVLATAGCGQPLLESRVDRPCGRTGFVPSWQGATYGSTEHRLEAYSGGPRQATLGLFLINSPDVLGVASGETGEAGLAPDSVPGVVVSASEDSLLEHLSYVAHSGVATVAAPAARGELFAVTLRDVRLRETNDRGPEWCIELLNLQAPANEPKTPRKARDAHP